MSEREWLDIFSDNLLDLMEHSGVTQHELSRRTGLTQGTISKYINCKQMPSIKAIINISYALHCDIGELMDFGDMID